MHDLMIPTSLRRVIFSSPDLSLSLRSNFSVQDAAPSLLPACGATSPDLLSQYAGGLPKQWKSSHFRKHLGGVTILQWFKRFDATLGFSLGSALHDYSERLHTRRAIA